MSLDQPLAPLPQEGMGFASAWPVRAAMWIPTTVCDSTASPAISRTSPGSSCSRRCWSGPIRTGSSGAPSSTSSGRSCGRIRSGWSAGARPCRPAGRICGSGSPAITAVSSRPRDSGSISASPTTARPGSAMRAWPTWRRPRRNTGCAGGPGSPTPPSRIGHRPAVPGPRHRYRPVQPRQQRLLLAGGRAVPGRLSEAGGGPAPRRHRIRRAGARARAHHRPQPLRAR